MNKAQKLVEAIKILEIVQGEGKVEIGVGHDVIYLGDSSIHCHETISKKLEALGVGIDQETDSYYLFV